MSSTFIRTVSEPVYEAYAEVDGFFI